MQKKLLFQAEPYVKQTNRRRIWKRLVGALACIVVFCTTYALILPAITLERDLVCGMEEHSHSEICYQTVTPEATVGGCILEELGIHVHMDCHDESCGFADYVIHSHDAMCYNADGQQTCQLPIVEKHEHSEACYTLPVQTAAHTHGDGCYEVVSELICQLAEVKPHSHGAACYDENGVVICTLEEAGGHTHDDNCCTVASNLICELPEQAGSPVEPGEVIPQLICTKNVVVEHIHSEECFVDGVWNCGLLETHVHQHDGSCLTATGKGEMQLVCALQEHIHDDTCRAVEQEKELQPKVIYYCGNEEHTHGMNCLDADGQIVCGAAEHIHDDSCLTEKPVKEPQPEVVYYCGNEEHAHGMNCLDADGQIICGTTEHIHADSCLTEKPIEEPQPEVVYYCGQGEHVHVQTCYFYDGALICGIMEHIHSEICSVEPTQAEITAARQVELLIEAMPSADEIDAQLLAYDDAEDYVGYEAYLMDVSYQVGKVNRAYQNLSFREQTLVRNRDKLLELEYIWSRVTLEEPVENPASPPVNPYDLGNYVNSVSVQHRAPGATGWQDVVNGSVQTGDALRFDIRYKIPGKVLSFTDRTVTYQVPITVTTAENGYVYNESDDIVGIYVINESGLIIIDFSTDYATRNGEGTEVSGHLAFQASVDSLNADSQGNVEIPFKKSIVLHITDKVNNTEDLQVDKTASNVNEENGAVDYTITVTSAKGTGDNVKLRDVMSGTQLVAESSIVVKDKNGAGVKVTPTVDGDGKFSLMLPQMGDGDSYTITCSTAVPNFDSFNGTVNVKNAVEVESTDESGGVLKDAAEVENKFERDLLSKDGKLEGNIITWEIKVNTSKLDIGGWTLSDQLGDTAYAGNVTITPNPNDGTGSLATQLPYTFPANAHSTKTYIVTYTTDITANGINDTSVRNEAFLKPQNGNGVSTGVTIVVKSDYDPLDKMANGVILNGREENGNKLADYAWTVTIDAKDSAIEPVSQKITDIGTKNVWIYSDELWNEDRHWITGAQLKALDASLRVSYSGTYEIYAYYWDGTGGKYRTPQPLASVGDADKLSQFRILFYDTLPQGQKLQFTYSSTGNVGTGYDAVSLTNWGSAGSRSEQVSQSYRPVVTKVDKKATNGNSGSETKHDINNADLPNKGMGILGWNTHVTLPGIVYTEDVVITENLPAGTKLLSEEYQERNLSFSNSLFYDGGNFDFKEGETAAAKTLTSKSTGETFDIMATKISETRYTITLPAALANVLAGTTSEIEVRVKIDQDFDWSTVSHPFENVVTVTTGTTQLGEASQTQVIRNPLIAKTSGTSVDNVIPYSLAINPTGKDLVPGSDTLTLTDVLVCETSSGKPVNASLLLDTVKVYRLENGGGRTDITAQCAYTFAESATGKDVRKTITMTIPDSTSLVVEYSYRVSGTSGTAVNLTSTASIEGFSVKVDQEEDKMEVEIQASNARTILAGVTIIKVDEENFNIRLDGATFRLEKRNPVTGEYELVGEYTTEDSGVISTGELEENTPYRLVEKSAPFGYAIDPTPYYFYIAGSGDTPEGFTGTVLNNSDSIIISNTKATYALPETGGSGTYLYTMGGLLMIIAAGSLLLYSYIKRRKEDTPSF